MTEKISIKDLEESLDLKSLKHNENLLLMGMKTLEAGEVLEGKQKTKYVCLAECKQGPGVKIQIFSFDEGLGVHDLRKGQSVRISGKLNLYKGSTNRLFYSIYVTKLEKK